MARINFNGNLPNLKGEKVRQGDFVYCIGAGGTRDFWGIYGNECGVVALDGGSTQYIREKEVYVGEIYSYWTIAKRIPCEQMAITLEELE